MKIFNLPQVKSFKVLRLNYRTFLMFLVISIILFFLLLLISGCKLEESFITSPIPKITNVLPAHAAAESSRISITEVLVENFIAEI